MSRSPLISICIPAYNAGHVIGSCLGSIADQSFDDYEVVIVDDGSKELTIYGSDQFPASAPHRVRLIRQENGGTYAARQRAIGEACGRYVFCMDADDTLAHTDALGHIARGLEKNSYPDVLLTNAIREDGTRCVDYSGLLSGLIEKKDVVGRFFLDCGWNSMFTMVFKRSLYIPASDRPRLLMAEDRLQKAEIFSKAVSFALCDEPLYIYRDVEGSAMNSPFEPVDFYNRAYVGVETLEMLDDLGASREAWAQSFNGYVATSLFELGMDKRRSRRERVALYPQLRNVDGCDEALVYYSDVAAWKDRTCLETFRDRRWCLLDTLLMVRRLVSNAKHLFDH